MRFDRAERIDGLAELADRFDAYLIDQFGVLHDGEVAYPGATEALQRLKASGARIALVSNSGKRARPNIERLTHLGFAPDSYDAFATSGEVAWGMLQAGAVPLPKGARVLQLSRGEDRSALGGLDLTTTDSAEDCDLVLIAGSEAERISLAAYRSRLAPAASRGVPALCTNPDFVMLTPRGPRFGAGEIARTYEALGGDVTWIGKPFAPIYEAALAAIGNPPPARTLCIGDSLDHDVAGGQGVGAKTLLVTGGIPLNEEAPSTVSPDFIANMFHWKAP